MSDTASVHTGARAIFSSRPSPRGVYGTDPDRVIDAIRHRALRQLTCRNSADGRRLGLVIEGGGGSHPPVAPSPSPTSGFPGCSTMCMPPPPA